METVELQVDGMTCAGCEQRVGAVLGRVEGVREVTADHTTGRVQVRIGPELADRDVLGQRIENAGYEVVESVGR